jgi:hypothetical protein
MPTLLAFVLLESTFNISCNASIKRIITTLEYIKKIHNYFLPFDILCKVAGLGLEPRLAVPETAVLPLDDPATLKTINLTIFGHITIFIVLRN